MNRATPWSNSVEVGLTNLASPDVKTNDDYFQPSSPPWCFNGNKRKLNEDFCRPFIDHIRREV